MGFAAVQRIVGFLIAASSLMMLPPVLVSLWYHDGTVSLFLMCAAILLTLGGAITDPNGDPLFYRIVATTHGTATLTTDGQSARFVPTPGHSGIATLSVVADDGFSNRIVSKLRRRICVNRLALPVAILAVCPFVVLLLAFPEPD